LQIRRCLYVISEIKENHLLCKSSASNNNMFELLIDTNTEVNIIKISKLRGLSS